MDYIAFLTLSVIVLMMAFYVYETERRLMSYKMEQDEGKIMCKQEVNRLIGEWKDATVPIAFYAYLSKNIATSSSLKHQTVVYDKVNLNLGNGYNEKTGHFTAPDDGLYLFHVSTGVVDRSWATIELVHDDIVADIGFPDSGEHTDRNHVTTATLLKLKKGTVIFVRVGEMNGGQYIESNNYIRTSFSGARIN